MGVDTAGQRGSQHGWLTHGSARSTRLMRLVNVGVNATNQVCMGNATWWALTGDLWEGEPRETKYGLILSHTLWVSLCSGLPLLSLTPLLLPMTS
jgi:hypothetical protein